MLIVVALFCIECAVSAVLIALPYLLVLRQDRGVFCRRIPEVIVAVKKQDYRRWHEGADSRDRKRGAVGARVDFLDVIGFDGAGTGEMPVL